MNGKIVLGASLVLAVLFFASAGMAEEPSFKATRQVVSKLSTTWQDVAEDTTFKDTTNDFYLELGKLAAKYTIDSCELTSNDRGWQGYEVLVGDEKAAAFPQNIDADTATMLKMRFFVAFGSSGKFNVTCKGSVDGKPFEYLLDPWWNSSYSAYLPETVKSEGTLTNVAGVLNGTDGIKTDNLANLADCKDLVYVLPSGVVGKYAWENYNETYGCGSNNAILRTLTNTTASNSTTNYLYFNNSAESEWRNVSSFSELNASGMYVWYSFGVLNNTNGFGDLSGSNRRATSHGFNQSVGKIGYGVNNTGSTTAKITTDDDWSSLYDQNGSFTIMFWAKSQFLYNGANHGYAIMFSTTGNTGWIFDEKNAGSGVWQVNSWNGAASSTRETSALTEQNVWHHLAFVYFGNLSFGVYKDGSFAGNLTMQWPNMDANEGMTIGNDGAGASPFKGEIDDFFAFKRALTQQEISWYAHPALSTLGSAISRYNESTQTYKSSVFENEVTTYSINITASTEPLISMLLHWNGTNYPYTAFINHTTSWEFSRNLTMPIITGNSEAVQAHWDWNVTSALGNSEGFTQTIYKPALTVCSGTSQRSRKFAFYNETSDFGAANGTMDAYIKFYESAGHEYVLNFTATNSSVWVCVYPAWTNFTADGHIQYRGNNSGEYSVRDYFLDNDEFSNNSAEFPLYLLSSALGTRVTITVKDEYSNPYKGVVVHIQRYYPHLNAYKTVASIQTDDAGKTNTYLVLYDVYYRFKIQLNGVVLDIIAERLITDTAIELAVSAGAPVEWLEYWGSITGDCAYASATGYLNCDYDDKTAAYLSSATLDVKEIGALRLSSVCSITNTSIPSGTMRCFVGNATSKKFGWSLTGTLAGGDTFVIKEKVEEAGAYISLLFGSCKEPANVAACKEGVILAFFLSLTCALIGIYNPTSSMVLMLVGIVASYLLGLLAISVWSLVGLMFVAGVIIYAIQRKEPI